MRADRSVLFNLSATALAEAGTKAAQFVTVVLIARALGPAEFGIVGAGWALFQLALPVVQGAPELVGVRNLSADRAGGVRWVSAIGAMKMILALGAAAALVIYAVAIYGPHSRSAVQVAIQSLVLFGVAASPAWAARSFQRTDLYASPRLLQAFLFVALVGGGLMLWPVPLAVPVADLVAWTVASACAFRILRPVLPGLKVTRALAAVADLRQARTVIAGNGRATFHFAAGGIASTAIWWVPVLMAETLFGAAAGGNVAAAVRLVSIALVAIQLGLQVFLPVLAKYHATDRERFRSVVAALAFYSTLAPCAIAIAIAAFAGPLAQLVFGPDFEGSVPLIAIFAVALVPLGTGSAYGYALIAANRSGVFFVVTVAGSIAMLAGQFAGMAATGTPVGLVWGLPFLALKTAALAVYAHGGGLVGRGIFSLRRLAPRNIVLFLMER